MTSNRRKNIRHQNGYGGVTYLGENRRKPYLARITVGYRDTGSQIYETIGYYVKYDDAVIALKEYNERKYNIIDRKISFLELYNKWSKKHFKKITEGSQQGYKTALNHCQSIYNKRFAELRNSDLQKVIDDCKKDYPIKQPIRNLFNMMYKFAKKNNIVKVIESEDLEVGEYIPKFDKKPFTDKEIEKLFDNADKIEYADNPLILIYSGMRIMEFLQLETKNIHLEDRYMIGGLKTKAGKDRVIPISMKTAKFIEKYYNPKNKYLITNEDGEPYTYDKYIRKRWHPLMEELRMNHTPHECKHTCATKLDNAGVNTMIKKKILGHSIGNDITDRYTHKSIQQVIDGIDMI